MLHIDEKSLHLFAHQFLRFSLSTELGQLADCANRCVKVPLSGKDDLCEFFVVEGAAWELLDRMQSEWLVTFLAFLIPFIFFFNFPFVWTAETRNDALNDRF